MKEVKDFQSMKFLILTYEIFPRPGGIQRYIHIFSKTLSKIFGQENVFVVPISGKHYKSNEYNLVSKIMKLPRRLKRFLAYYFFSFLCRENRPDLIIFNHINFFTYGWIARKLKIPYQVIVYGSEVWGNLGKFKTRFLENASAIISISEFTKKCLINSGIDTEKIKLLHFGIDMEEFRILPSEKNPLRIISKNILLSVCRLEGSERHKGYDKIIEILPDLSQEFTDIKYIVIGDGTDKTRIMNLAKELGVFDKLVLPGAITDVNTLVNYYNLCDIFVMPSYFCISKDRVIGEGFGFVYLEAAACGKPVIAGKGGGCPEAIEDGVSGFLVDPNDKKGLYETIVKLLRDKELAKKMGAAGRKRVEENFSYEVFLKKVKEIFL